MRTKHQLFLTLGTTPKSRAKVCAQWRMSLSPHPPGSLLPTVIKSAILVQFLLYVNSSRFFMSYFVFYCWLFICEL